MLEKILNLAYHLFYEILFLPLFLLSSAQHSLSQYDCEK
jgi:hypothetical protein